MTRATPEGEIHFGRSAAHYELTAAQWLPTTREKAWAFLGDCRHLNFVLPRFIQFSIIDADDRQTPPGLAPGVTYDYRLRLHWFAVRWRTLITEVSYPDRFVDIQQRGPYESFTHEHDFEPDPVRGGLIVRDRIVYRPPGKWLAPIVNWAYVRPSLRRLFINRHQKLRELFAEGADPQTLFEPPPIPAAAPASPA